MRFGLGLPTFDYSYPDGPRPASVARLAQTAKLAEGMGFSSVWVPDHFFLSLAKYGGGETLHGSLEPFTALGALTAATERARIGTMVACVPFRHPALVARMSVTLDAFSEGRFELGLGAGWYEEEFEPFGYGFGSLGERFDELEAQVQIIDALSSADGPVDIEAGDWKISGGNILPRAVQAPRVPLWVGAKGGPRAMRLIARHADGWNTVWRMTPATYEERLAVLAKACEREGRDPSSVRKALGLYLLIGEDQADLVDRWHALQAWTPGGALDGEPLEDYARDTLTGTPERIHALIARYEDLGVEEIIVNAASMPFAISDLDQLQMFSDEIIRAAS